jgi:hypothetical protein
MRRREREGEQRCTLCVRYADQKKGKRCVCGLRGDRLFRPRGFATQREICGKARRKERNAEQGEPVRKGNHGSDEGDPKPPSVSERERGQRRAGLEKRVEVFGDEQEEPFAGFDVECTGRETWGCAPTRLDCSITI